LSFLPPLRTSIEGEPTPDIDVERTDPAQPAEVITEFPTETETKMTLQNVRLVHFRIYEHLKVRGLTPQQINSYINRIALLSERFFIAITASSEIIFLIDMPQPWVVRGVLVDGKKHDYYYDRKINRVLFIVSTKSTTEVTFLLTSTLSTTINWINLFFILSIIGSFAYIILGNLVNRLGE